MKCNCYICGKEFDRKPALIRRAEHPVCSRACQSILKQREWVEIECCICGKPLLRRKSRLKTRTYNVCSKECKAVLTHRLCYDESITDEVRRTDRNYFPENRVFVKSVLQRDDYTCQICGKRGGNLAAHHINGFNWDADNRFNPDNGITLCESCHRGFHAEYGYGNNTSEQFNGYANQNRRSREA